MLHEEARTKVCLGCFRKCSQNLHSAQPVLIQRIKDHLVKDIDITDSRVPIGFCESCRLKLQAVATKKDAKPFDLGHLHSYLETQKRISPRAPECTCFVCKLASAFGGKALKLSKEYKKSGGRPSSEPQKAIHRLCGLCHRPLYSGCSHNCDNTQLAANILSSCPENILDQISSGHLKNKAENAESKQLFLKTYGTPLPVTIGHENAKPLQFSHQQLDHMQGHGDFTGSQMIKC